MPRRVRSGGDTTPYSRCYCYLSRNTYNLLDRQSFHRQTESKPFSALCLCTHIMLRVVSAFMPYFRCKTKTPFPHLALLRELKQPIGIPTTVLVTSHRDRTGSLPLFPFTYRRLRFSSPLLWVSLISARIALRPKQATTCSRGRPRCQHLLMIRQKA